ncbi:site-specific DNA-methyltransferase [Limosilactobacillus reuteri]|uniref:site-specific DNA-methyltransferase n=1 Tax=Limosilactobacillus reuteri TaxID=1598 RepID=UPI002FF3F685
MNENTRFNPVTKNFRTEAAKKLAELFPEVVADGQIDIDALEELLDPDLEDEESNEKYEFTWRGKRNSKRIADAPARNTTLIADKDDSKDWNNTKNVYIEGDNLEVLKLMQKAYSEKVKMIYVDPPYNTGHDFVYKDRYHEPYKNYLKETGQLDEEGNITTTNRESNGRFHTDWLNMMFPRLRLARKLLSEDGVIFVSIDNNEIENIIRLMNETFGENNQLGIISDINNPKGRSDDKFIATAHEYLVVYAKNSNKTSWYGFQPTEKIIKRYNKIDKNGDKYREIDLRKTGEKDLRQDRPKMFYYFYYNPETKDFYPSKEDQKINGYIQIKPLREDQQEGRWRWGFDTAVKNLSELFPKYMPARKIWGVMQKDYLKNRALVKPTSSWAFKDVNSERGTESFKKLGFKKEDFAKPKPVGTLKRCIELSTRQEDLILDLFGGSSTTAQAVMEQNVEDEGKRRFVLIQLPEKIKPNSIAYEDGYKTISEIGKERIRRAGELIKGENNLDVGFRSYKLAATTIKQWDDNPDNFQKQLELFQSPFTRESTNDQRALEIAIKSGVTLDISPEIDSNNYHFVTDDKEVFVILGDYDEDLLESLNKQRKLPNATVVLREMDEGSETKFNLIEKLKQEPKLNDHFNLEWL